MRTISVNPQYDEIESILTVLFNELCQGGVITGKQLLLRLEERGFLKEKPAKVNYKLGKISRVINRGKATGKFANITKINVREYDTNGNFRNMVAYSKIEIEEVEKNDIAARGESKSGS